MGGAEVICIVITGAKEPLGFDKTKETKQQNSLVRLRLLNPRGTTNMTSAGRDGNSNNPEALSQNE